LTVKRIIQCISLITVFCHGNALLAQDDLPFSSGSNGSDGALEIPTTLSAREHHAAAYDAARDRTVVFGGSVGNTYLGDTWLFDGTEWIPVTPANSPPIRRQHMMAYDSVRERVVLYGGWNGSARLNDTWEWDGNNWTNVSPILSPSPRSSATMAYDAVNQEVVLFGGNTGSRVNETWVFNGTAWTKKSPATSPSVRDHAAMTWDGLNNRVFLFGGYSGQSDTWGWDGTNWTLIPSPVIPPGRHGHSIAYDATSTNIIMWGGSNSANYYDTWRFVGGSGWEQVFPVEAPNNGAPRNFYHSAMVYHAGTLNRVLHIAGYMRNVGQIPLMFSWDRTNWYRSTGNNYYFDMRDRIDGIWNFTTIDVPAGVSVYFVRNTGNTPIRWLASGHVNIEGSLRLDGQNGFASELGGVTSIGGPGGFDGGLGGIAFNNSGSFSGSPGKGPGGGTAGTNPNDNAADGGGWASYYNTYGNNFIIPLIGGSGGGGTASTETENGSSGGGGGGALLIASSRDITLSGFITAKGGNYIYDSSGSIDDYSGRGSGGAVKLVADRLLGAGTIDVRGGGDSTGNQQGRIRLEGFERPMANNPHSISPSSSTPVTTNYSTFMTTQPTLTITQVAGEAVTQPPSGNTGSPDVIFSAGGSINIVVEGTNIPDGTPIKVRVTFTGGSVILPTVGEATILSGTAVVTGTIPSGLGTLEATAEFLAN
jgi:hypothetical protein